MHPVFSKPGRMLGFSLAWLVLSLFFTALLVIAAGAQWAAALQLAVPMTLLYGFLNGSAYYVCRSVPLQRRSLWRAVGVFGSAALLAGLAWLALCQSWNKAGAFTEPLPLTPQLSALVFVLGSGMYLLAILGYDLVLAFDNLRQAERRETASLLLARDAELQVLRSQIDPHFLFNSLNSISALTAINPAAARDMTVTLAQFFRMTLALPEKAKITLAEELSLCEHFLSIEKIRFGERLQLAWQIDPASRSALIPPMLLQPLAENAIKHGIRNLAGPGTLSFFSVVRDGWLHITLTNPYDSDAPATPGTGTGLRNLQQRLQALYGERARARWHQQNSEFTIEISLEYEPSRT